MRAQLPVRSWVDLPESRTIAALARTSTARVARIAAAQPRSAAEWVPAGATLPVLAEAVRECGAASCADGRWRRLGQGKPRARVMLVGEQPGNEEDRAGRPFVGPAGQVLDSPLAAAGVDRDALYVTNAVKAFRFEEREERGRWLDTGDARVAVTYHPSAVLRVDEGEGKRLFGLLVQDLIFSAASPSWTSAGRS